MSKLRSVSTAFWSDPFIEELTPNQKLLFLYLITNEKTNMLGIYESSIKKISFETGIIEKTIISDLKHFELKNKVRYVKNYVILLNFMKHQNFNTNMMKSAIDVYNSLPNELKDSNIVISKDNPLKGFETLCNHFGMVRKIEVEVEYEDEREYEDEPKEDKKDFNIFWNLYNKKVGNKDKCEKKWNKLKSEIQEKIINTLPLFISQFKDKQYQPFPETYLNQERWSDEIYNTQKPIKNDLAPPEGQPNKYGQINSRIKPIC